MDDFYPPAIFFDGTWFALNRIMLIKLFMVAFLCIFFILAFRKSKLVPRGIQNMGEIAIDFVKDNIASEILGKTNGRKFLPVVATVFFLSLFLNVTGIIPFMNISANGLIGMPLILALFAYINYIAAGVKKYGAYKYVKATIVMPDVPSWIQPILIPIEFISNFVLQPFTLTVRLMANMLSGHLLLVLFYSGAYYFWHLGILGKFGSVFPVLLGIVFTFFELLVIFLQAYIFALLVSVYLDKAINADSH